MIQNKFVLVMSFVFFMALPVVQAKQGFGVVGLESTKLYSKPAIFSKKVTTLEYADRVQIKGDKRGWVKVSVTKGGKTFSGWLKSHAIETRDSRVAEIGKGEVVATNGGFSEKDVGTVGKGFDPATEKAYRDKNPEKNFADVDYLTETYKFNEMNLHPRGKFVRGGQLKSRIYGKRRPANQRKKK